MLHLLVGRSIGYTTILCNGMIQVVTGKLGISTKQFFFRK